MTIPTEWVKRCGPVNAYGDAHVVSMGFGVYLKGLKVFLITPGRDLFNMAKENRSGMMESSTTETGASGGWGFINISSLGDGDGEDGSHEKIIIISGESLGIRE
jgi:hypothetical protein